MAHPHKALLLSLKSFLALAAVTFALAALLLTLMRSSAATGIGSDPINAITLTAAVNTGILGPGEQRWFRIIPAQNQSTIIEKTLTFSFTSTDNDSARPFIAMQIFTQEQIQNFNPQTPNLSESLGAGQEISTANSQTDNLFWAGQLQNNQTYYIQIINDSDYALEYRLTAEDTNNSTAAAVVSPPQQVSAAPPVVPEMGTTPSNAALLVAGLTKGRLAAQSTAWYTFVHNDLANSSQIQPVEFSMFFTPDDGNARHSINFELFTADAVKAWQRGDAGALANFGAGMLVSRDGDLKTGERLWSGTVIRDDVYYLAVENNSNIDIDYWLFDNDVDKPQLGTEPAPVTLPVFATGAAPQTALPLNFNQQNTGRLEPGQEVWYSFSLSDNDSEFFEEMALTMIATPADGNRLHYITFDVFTAEGVKGWSPGDNSQIQNVGAGSLVFRDDNEMTAERFWTGWVAENDLYYVQLRNGADTRMDYWLFTADIYGPELGNSSLNN